MFQLYLTQLEQKNHQQRNLLNDQFSSIINTIKVEIPEIYNDISSLKLDYIKGWDGNDFRSIIDHNQIKDRNIGYTSAGTHRSDFVVTSEDKPVRESGSMSTLVLACLIINLSKINVFHVKHSFKPILLIDDLFFGIDNKNLDTVIKLLIYSKGNIVVSAPNIYKEILEKVSLMNDEIEPILIGEVDDIDVGSVENFEYDDVNYAIYRLESGFFATEGNCPCAEKTLLSESSIEGEELECPTCGNKFSIVSGDSISDLEQTPLKIFDVTEEDGNLYLNI